MGKTKIVKFSVIISLIVFSMHFSNAFDKRFSRKINIAGLVVNAKNLSAIEAAKIYDSANHLLGTTDEKGYFNISIDYKKAGAISFKLKIVKAGYQDFLQHENWSDISSDTKNTMYFGLQNLKTEAKPFSSFPDKNANSSDLSFNNVLANFSQIETERTFENKLEAAKAGNENVFIEIDNEFYIVDNGGWIKIDSANDLISLNNKQALTADKLNAAIKRKSIKSMTPLNAKNEKFAIYTR